MRYDFIRRSVVLFGRVKNIRIASVSGLHVSKSIQSFDGIFQRVGDVYLIYLLLLFAVVLTYAMVYYIATPVEVQQVKPYAFAGSKISVLANCINEPKKLSTSGLLMISA